MRIRLALAATLAVAASVAIGAAQNAPAPKQTGAKAPATTDGRMPDLKPNGFLKVTIHTSRAEVTVDGAYGVFADFENTATAAIKLYQSDVELIVQPEVTYSGTCSFRIVAWFPTEPEETEEQQKVATAQAGQAPPADRRPSIQIQPNEHYTVVWNVSRHTTSNDGDTGKDKGKEAECTSRSWFAQLLSFAPGSYTFTVVGKLYGDDANPAGAPAGSAPLYHTFTESTTLKVTVPQISAMVAAGFGGLIAYLVMVFRTDSNKDFDNIRTAASKKDWKGTAGYGVLLLVHAISAFLLAAVITVVMNRLSDTHFPISVSVNDVWGAMTIGFVSYFMGDKLIDTIASKAKTPPPAPPANPPAAAPNPPAPPAGH